MTDDLGTVRRDAEFPSGRRAYLAACTCLFALIAFMLVRELVFAPLRPGGSLLALKVLPLILAVPGIMRRRIYTFQWSALLILVYVAFAIVSGMSDTDPRSRVAGWIEAALALAFFFAALTYVMPFKRAHRERQREGRNSTHRTSA